MLAACEQGLTSRQALQDPREGDRVRRLMMQQIHDKAQMLLTSENTRLYIQRFIRPEVSEAQLDDPEMYAHIVRYVVLNDLTSIILLTYGIIVVEA